MHKGPLIKKHIILVDKIIAVSSLQHILFINDGGRPLEPHLLDAGVIEQGVGVHLVLGAVDLHILDEEELLDAVAIIAEVALQGLVAANGDGAVGITGQMLVAVVGKVFGVKRGGVVHQLHVVVELGKAGLAIIVQQVAEDLHAVVDNDMDVLVGVETVGLLVVIGAVAVEVRRVVAHLHIADEALHVAHTLRIGGFVVVFDINAGLLALHSVTLLRRNRLR